MDEFDKGGMKVVAMPDLLQLWCSISCQATFNPGLPRQTFMLYRLKMHYM